MCGQLSLLAVAISALIINLLCVDKLLFCLLFIVVHVDLVCIWEWKIQNKRFGFTKRFDVILK